jgi:ATP-dependent DNA ligase
LVDALRLATYSAAMPLPRGFVPPCLPTKAPQPPSGDVWVHEIKHDGYRLMARRDSFDIRLLTRNGHDWAAAQMLANHARGIRQQSRTRAREKRLIGTP